MAKSWSTYLGEVFGFAGGEVALGPLNVDWGAVVIVAIVTALLAVGTKLSSNVSAVITLIKVAVVLVVIVVGAFYIKAANFSPFIPPAEPGGGAGEQSLFSLLTGAGSSNYGWYGLLAGASIVFFAFIGFDVVATTAEETKDPQRDVPRGIFGTLAIVTVLYVAVAVVLSGMVKYSELAKAGEDANLATAFSLNGVDWAATFVLVSAGVIILRRSRPDLHRAFRVPFVPWLPIAAIAACLWLMVNLTALTWIRFIVWMAIGVSIYLLYGRRHSKLAERGTATSA